MATATVRYQHQAQSAGELIRCVEELGFKVRPTSLSPSHMSHRSDLFEIRLQTFAPVATTTSYIAMNLARIKQVGFSLWSTSFLVQRDRLADSTRVLVAWQVLQGGVASSPPQHPGVQDTTLRIGGMHCESCAQVGPPRADQSEKTLRVIESLACNESLWYHHTCRRRRHPRLSALPQRLQTATPNKRPLPHRLSRSLPLCLDCISLAVSRTASLSVSPTVCPTVSLTVPPTVSRMHLPRCVSHCVSLRLSHCVSHCVSHAGGARCVGGCARRGGRERVQGDGLRARSLHSGAHYRGAAGAGTRQQQNSCTQGLKCLISLCTNPVSILNVLIQTVR